MIALQQQLNLDLTNIQSLGEELDKLQIELAESYKISCDLASKISQKRAAAIPDIEKEICFLLSALGMPDASIQINQHPSEEIHLNGKEEIVFYFSANKGGDLQEIVKVASGGELSRLMLCIKYLMASKTQMPTIIFDEIDSGVSGEIAHKMGVLMQQMSINMQVIGITHLPQVALKVMSNFLSLKITHKQCQRLSFLNLTGMSAFRNLLKCLVAAK